VARKLALTGAIPCALAGSVIVKEKTGAEALKAAAEEPGLHLTPLTPVVEPAQGAIRLSRATL